jgi:hypothetical protein
MITLQPIVYSLFAGDVVGDLARITRRDDRTISGVPGTCYDVVLAEEAPFETCIGLGGQILSQSFRLEAGEIKSVAREVRHEVDVGEAAVREPVIDEHALGPDDCDISVLC